MFEIFKDERADQIIRLLGMKCFLTEDSLDLYSRPKQDYLKGFTAVYRLSSFGEEDKYIAFSEPRTEIKIFDADGNITDTYSFDEMLNILNKNN